MSGSKALPNLEIRNEVEKKAKNLLKIESRMIIDLNKYENKRYANFKIATVIIFLLLLIVVMTAFFVKEELYPLLLFVLLFLGIYLVLFLTMIFDRINGRIYFVGKFSVSERYKFYINILRETLDNYNKVKDVNLKKIESKKIRGCIANLYRLSYQWDNQFYNKPYIINMFTSDLDNFNIVLRMFLFRLNGYVYNLKIIPEGVYSNLVFLTDHLNINSIKMNEKHLKYINALVQNLENSDSGIYKFEFYDRFLSKKLKNIWGKTRKWITIIFSLFLYSLIYWILIILTNINISNDAKFMVYGSIFGVLIIAFVQLLKDN